MTNQTQLFIIFGHPVEHSLSPLLYECFLKQFPDIQLNYAKKLGLLKLGSFERQVREFFSQENSAGANITAPFKQRAFDLVDIRTQRAKISGAVNSIFKLPGGELEGDNTDGVGLIRDIEINQDFKLKHKKILILGAGGAVAGVLPSFLAAQPSEIIIVNRDINKAIKLAETNNIISAKSYFDLAQEKIKYNLIINSTPLSLSNKLPNITPALLDAENSLCYDMVYKPEYTVFTRWAEKHGCAATDGLGMLIEQGAENFYRWFNKRPETTEVFTQLRLL